MFFQDKLNKFGRIRLTFPQLYDLEFAFQGPVPLMSFQDIPLMDTEQDAL